MNKYKDIINLPHHISKNHPRMTLENRAAQFAPFSALTGYAEKIKETARITDKQIELDEGLKSILNYKLNIIQENIKSKPQVIITYFIKDQRKSGGTYQTINIKIKKIDEINKIITDESNNKINIDNIIDIKSNIFKITM